MATCEFDDETMFNLMKDMPDFDSFPIPQSWYKKFNIPPRNPIGVKEYIESGYAMKRAIEKKDLPPLIIDTPQQGGKLAIFIPEEKVQVDMISRPFVLDENTPFPAILPSLKDETLLEQVQQLKTD
jgi:hypothetical protein